MTEVQERPATRSGASVERIVKVILSGISTGHFGPGEQLRQEDLARELGVSRVPVREALQALLEQRVLVHEKHRGFFVAKRTPSELAQLHRMIEMIEDEVMTTIELPTEQDLQHLRSLNERMLEVADQEDVTETQALNFEFHFAIFRLSPNYLMVDELERLWRLVHSYLIMRMIEPESRRMLIAEHADLIDRLAAHDRDGVAAALRRHRDAPRRGPVREPFRQQVTMP
jgi:DNA-binding GntR family transcriptional regulator